MFTRVKISGSIVAKRRIVLKCFHALCAYRAQRIVSELIIRSLAVSRRVLSRELPSRFLLNLVMGLRYISSYDFNLEARTEITDFLINCTSYQKRKTNETPM